MDLQLKGCSNKSPWQNEAIKQTTIPTGTNTWNITHSSNWNSPNALWHYYSTQRLSFLAWQNRVRASVFNTKSRLPENKLVVMTHKLTKSFHHLHFKSHWRFKLPRTLNIIIYTTVSHNRIWPALGGYNASAPLREFCGLIVSEVNSHNLMVGKVCAKESKRKTENWFKTHKLHQIAPTFKGVQCSFVIKKQSGTWK